jgi:polar amino acid transport system substrate-binding protein
MRKTLLSLAALMTLAVPAAFADQLADMRTRGVLTCGVFSGAEPFAFQDAATREMKGYDIDVCKGIAARLGVKSEIKVVSLEARIPELQQGRVDVLAAVLGYNAARAEQIVFSNTYFVSRQMVAVKAGSVNKLDDLAGKRISSVKGSSNIPMVQKVLPTATVVSYEDTSTAFMAMIQNKVDGFVASEAALRRFAHKLGAQASSIVVAEPAVASEHWGLGLRKGEAALEIAVNGALTSMEKDGEVDRIFNRWMGSGSEYQMKRSFTVAPIPR